MASGSYTGQATSHRLPGYPLVGATRVLAVAYVGLPPCPGPLAE